MKEFNKNALVATVCGVPIASFDTTEISIKPEGFSFGVYPESNALLILSDCLGRMVDYKLEYIGEGCDGLQSILGKLFEEEGSGILQIQDITLKDKDSVVVFTISPPEIFS